jgi:hypothetical protein
MQSQLKRKVLAIGFVALFAFVTTIGATFAWFTIGGATNIEPVQLTVTSSTSLLIRMDNPDYDYANGAGQAYYQNPSNYVSTLDTATILAAYAYDNIRFRPVTTTNGTTITYRDPAEQIQPSSSVASEGDGQYIEFKVWIMSQSVSVVVALQDYNISATNANTNKNDVIESIRMSLTAASTTLIYGIDKDYDFEFYVDDEGFDSVDEENNIAPDGVPAALALLHGVFNKTTGSGTLGESVAQNISGATSFITLTANVPTQVTIRIWSEGWDVDSDNNIIRANFALGFTFAVKQVL